jgi:hypothetical protein
MSANSDIAKLQRFVDQDPTGIFDAKLAAALVRRLGLDEPEREHPVHSEPSAAIQGIIDACP